MRKYKLNEVFSEDIFDTSLNDYAKTYANQDDRYIKVLQIKQWLDKYYIKNYRINDDLTIDVDGDVIINWKDLTSIDVQFNKVSGNFDCENSHLTSLEGCPQKVGGHFNCSYNKLTSLEGAPQKVGGDFYCDNNQLTSLKGSPQKIRGNFDCRHNELISLEGGPQKVGGYFDCRYNQLTSLEGCPKEVDGNFMCYNNPGYPFPREYNTYTHKLIKKTDESFSEDIFDTPLNDYSKTYANQDNKIVIEKWLAPFIKNFKPEDFELEYIDGEWCINVLNRKNVNILLTENETYIPYKFNKVDGDFDCSWCGLTTLKNCPNEINGTFNCSYNNLTKLDFIPIANYYNLSYNNISLNSIKDIIHKRYKHTLHPRRHNGRLEYDSYHNHINVKGNRKLIKYTKNPLYSEYLNS